MTQIKTKIPAEMEPAAVGGMVTDAKYIIDRERNKTQTQINTETDERITTEVGRAQQAESTLDGKIAAEKTRAEGVEGGLNTRLQTVEELATISVGGGDIGIGTAADFESDDPEDLAKVPTVGAMLGGANDGVYDISARHSGTKYADLAAALGTNGANVPVGVRKGGMSVKFVQSSDNKYVQFRLMSDSFNTTVENWQGVDDEPTAGSDNMVKSGGVAELVLDLKCLDGMTSTEQNVAKNIKYFCINDSSYEGYRITVVYNDNSLQHRIGMLGPNNQWRYADNAVGRINIGGITIEYDWDGHTENMNITAYANGHIEATSSAVSKLISKTKSTIDSEIKELETSIKEKTVDCFLSSDNPTTIEKSVFDCIEYLNIIDEKYVGYRICVAYNDTTFDHRIGMLSPSGAFTYKDNCIGYTAIGGVIINYNWDNHTYNYAANDYATAGIEFSISEVTRKIHDNTDTLAKLLLPLKGKNITILGDSIMMLMRTNYTGSNIVTFKDTNDNVYQCSEVTTDGAGNAVLISDNTVQVTQVNSNQAELNNQNWEALANLLKVRSLTNLGVGGARLIEHELVTDCPTEEYGISPVPYALWSACLPNEVRWLKALTQNETKPTPDCIVIWCGTNESANNPSFDNYDTIMGLSWEALSADTAQGHNYRKTVYGGLRYSIEFLCREYPLATIILLSPIQSRYFATQEYDTGNMQQIADAIQKMAERYSCVFIDALRTCGIVDLFEKTRENPSFPARWLSDGLHPNEAGKILLSNFLAKRVNTLYFNKR